MTRDGAGGQKFGRARAGTFREKFFVLRNKIGFSSGIPLVVFVP